MISSGFYRCRCGISLAAVVIPLIAAGCTGPNTLVDGDVAFVRVSVLPMDSERVLDDQTVIVADGRIAAMGPSRELGAAEGVEVVEVGQGYLIPGFVEMHGHLPNAQMADMDIKNLLFLYVANGVTTVRGMQGHQSQFGMRDQIDRGLVLGPRLFLGSVPMGGASVSTPEEATQLVREYKVAGYDLIKTLEGLTPETFRALVEAAEDVGIPFGGHVSDEVGLRDTLAAGQVSIDHLDNYIKALVPDDPGATTAVGMIGLGGILDSVDESLINDLVQATVDAGTWVVPTMVLWETAFFPDRPAAQVVLDRPEIRFVPPEMVVGWTRQVDERILATNMNENARVVTLRRRLLQALHRGGANIVLGSDSPQSFNVPGFSTHHEMEFYVDIGMTPYQVLEIGTRRAAEYFGKVEDFGTVAVGQRADLVLLKDNPLKDISNVTRQAGVMVNGRWLPEEQIQRRLTEISQFYGN